MGGATGGFIAGLVVGVLITLAWAEWCTYMINSPGRKRARENKMRAELGAGPSEPEQHG